MNMGGPCQGELWRPPIAAGYGAKHGKRHHGPAPMAPHLGEHGDDDFGGALWARFGGWGVFGGTWGFFK